MIQKLARSIRRVSWVLACASILIAADGAHPERDSALRAQTLVAEYLAADGGEIVLTADRLGAERDSLNFPGVEVWRVELPVDHAHPYLVAITRTRAIPLAGFSTPDLYAISRLVKRHDHTVQGSARLLAFLADPNGSTHVVFPFTDAPRLTSDSGFVRLWRESLPGTWPRDTTFEVQGGAHVVVESVLSRDTRDFGLRWNAVVYRFVLAPDGTLESWARASTGPFQMPEQMGALVD